MTITEHKSNTELTKDAPYLSLTCELWGVCCEEFRENYLCYNGSTMYTLQWCHDQCDGVSNHWHLHCFLHHLFRHRSEKKSSISLAFMRRIYRWLVDSPYKGPVTRKMFPFDDVIMFTGIGPLVLLSKCKWTNHWRKCLTSSYDKKPGHSQPILTLMSVGPLIVHLSKISNKIQIFSCNKMHLKILSAKCGPFYWGLTMLLWKGHHSITNELE